MSTNLLIATYDPISKTISLYRLKDNQYLITEDQLGLFKEIFKESEKKYADDMKYDSNNNHITAPGKPQPIFCNTGDIVTGPDGSIGYIKSMSDRDNTCAIIGGVEPVSKVEINGTKVSKKIFDDFLKAGNK